MKDLTIVTVDNLHESIRSFIMNGSILISNYEDMKEVILNMIKFGYMFNMDRDRVRDAMEDMTFMLLPTDDAIKDRVERSLDYDEFSDDSGDSDDSDIEDIGSIE